MSGDERPRAATSRTCLISGGGRGGIGVGGGGGGGARAGGGGTGDGDGGRGEVDGDGGGSGDNRKTQLFRLEKNLNIKKLILNRKYGYLTTRFSSR